MKKRIKLLKAWKHMNGDTGTDYPAGTILEVDQATGESLLSTGVAKSFSEEEETAEKAAADVQKKNFKTTIREEIKTAVSEMDDDEKKAFAATLGIKVTKDPFEDSPTWGYEKGDNVTKAGFGAFLGDVYQAAQNAKSGVGGIPERLTLAMGKRAEQIKSAQAAGMIGKANAFGGQNVTIDTEGGFAVPHGYGSLITTTNVENDWIRPRAMSVSMATKTLSFPMATDYDHSNGTIHGGVIAYWKGEEHCLELSKMKFDARKLELNKLTVMGKATHELMKFSDGISIGSFLIPLFANAIRFKEACAFLYGTGAGMPLGLSSSNSRMTIAKDPGQMAGTITTMNLFNMCARFKSNMGGGSVWVAHKSILPQLQSLTLGDQPIWLPSNSIAGRPHATLLGIPLLFTEYAKVLGGKGDIMLADIGSYIVADDTQGPEIARSIHVEFDCANEWFRILKYVDGKPLWSKPFTDKQGYQTAPVVDLEARV